MGGVFCITPNARWSWRLVIRILFLKLAESTSMHLGLLYTVPWFTQFLYNILKLTRLQSHSVSIGEFSVHDIPNFETPLVRDFVPYLDSVTSRRLKDFVMCLELALSGAILNFPRTLLFTCDPLFGVLIGLFSCAPAWPGAPSSPWPRILSSSSCFLFLEHVSADGSTFPWWPLSCCLLCWFKWWLLFN